MADSASGNLTGGQNIDQILAQTIAATFGHSNKALHVYQLFQVKFT